MGVFTLQIREHMKVYDYMNNKNTHQKSIIALAISGLFYSGLAFSQEEGSLDEEANDTERVTVTGSRIKGVDLEGAQPLVTITAEDIAKSGATSVYDLLRNLGQTRGGDGSFSTTESGALSTDTPAGSAAISLRGLGASSTLTLINGRRVAAASFAKGTQNFVDVNSIPPSAIERIDVLATGASATYGADAVAGVVNYILKKDYEGGSVNVSYGDSQESTNESQLNFNAFWGQKLGEGHLSLFVDYFKRDDFAYPDREQTAGTFATSTYSPFPRIRFRSSASGSGFALPGCPAENLVIDRFGDELCEYNPNDAKLVYPERESISAGFIYNYDFGKTRFFTDVFVSQNEAQAQTAATRWRDMRNRSSWLNFDVANPAFDPIRDQLVTRSGSSISGRDMEFVYVRGRFVAPRTIENKTTNFRSVVGLEGEFSNDWTWESGVLYSQSKSDQEAVAGIYNRERFNASLAGELCSDGSVNCTPETGGLYYNPLNGQANNEQILDLLSQDRPSRNGKSTTISWDFNTSGDLWDVDSGTISAAFGVEVRHEEITDEPSESAKAQFDNNYLVDVIGFGSSASAADRTQFAAYAEFNVPIADNFDAQIAGRYDYYNDFGGDFNPKIGLRYSPTEELVLRASWATSFRAPSLTQAGIELRTTTSNARCLSEFADIYCDGDTGGEINPFTLELGNQDLEPEEAENLNVGFAYSPTDDITVSVDYWQFEHENIIDTDLESLLIRTLTEPNTRFCGLVPPDQLGISYDQEFCDGLGLQSGFSGDLSSLLASWQLIDTRADAIPLFSNHILQLENVGQQETKGLDFSYRQNFDTELGDFSFALNATRLISFTETKSAFALEEQKAGSFRYPQLTGSISLNWNNENWFAGFLVDYTSDYTDEIALLDSGTIGRLEDEGIGVDRRVPSWAKVDAHLGYNVNDDFTLSLNIENLFDRDPPFVYGRYANVDLINHTLEGRYFTLRASYKF